MNFPADTPSLGLRKLRHRGAVPRVHVITWLDAKPSSCSLLPCQPSTTGQGPVGIASLVMGPKGLVSTVYPALATLYHFPEPNIASEGPKQTEAPLALPRCRWRRGWGKGLQGEVVCVCVCQREAGWDPGALKGRHARLSLPWPPASTQPLEPSSLLPSVWPPPLTRGTDFHPVQLGMLRNSRQGSWC